MRYQEIPSKLPAAESLTVNNPCVGICSTSTVGSVWCVGCNRYYKDVIAWNRYSVEEKILAMQRAVEHRKAKEKGFVDDNRDYLAGKVPSVI